MESKNINFTERELLILLLVVELAIEDMQEQNFPMRNESVKEFLVIAAKLEVGNDTHEKPQAKYKSIIHKLSGRARN